MIRTIKTAPIVQAGVLLGCLSGLRWTADTSGATTRSLWQRMTGETTSNIGTTDPHREHLIRFPTWIRSEWYVAPHSGHETSIEAICVPGEGRAMISHFGILKGD